MLSTDAGFKWTLEEPQPLSPRCLNAASTALSWLFLFFFNEKKKFLLICLICIINANKYFH